MRRSRKRERSLDRLGSRKEFTVSEGDTLFLGVRDQERCILERYQTARAAFFLRRHPAVDARDVLAGNLRAFLHTKFGDDRFSGFEIFFAHVAIFAIIAIYCQAKFANFAIEVFAYFASIAT